MPRGWHDPDPLGSLSEPLPTSTVDGVEANRGRLVATVGAVALIGLGVVAITGRGSPDGATPPPTTVISDAVVDRFLEDFETSLTATFTSTSIFERLQGETQAFQDEVQVVQRGLDRLTHRDGAISGRLDGRVVSCTGRGDDTTCLVGEDRIDVEAEIAEQVAAVRDYIDGPQLLYGVSSIDPQDVRRVGGESDRCYTLELVRQLPLAPYGTLARFCFDPASGAPTLLRVERPEAIDITAATAVSAVVTDADLTLPG